MPLQKTCDQTKYKPNNILNLHGENDIKTIKT